MLEEPQIVTTTAQHYAALHLVVPRSEIGNVMWPGVQEVMAAVAAQGMTPAGPWFTHHLTMPPGKFDFEICVPVATPVAPAGRVQPGVWPAMRLARTVYSGPFEGLFGAWGEFGEWMAAQQLSPAADLYERYLSGPESSPDPAQWRTELNRPLAE